MIDFHPIANIFPLMIGAEYDALVSDIAEHGQHEAIWLYEGTVLDAREKLADISAITGGDNDNN